MFCARFVSSSCLITALALGNAPPLGPVQDQTNSIGSVERVVHHFDFDERTVGNLEEVPKYWVALRPNGFPHFANAAFDREVGRAAPPSFHLAGKGRNVAYHYAGPETRVRINSDYRIEAYIRPDRLHYARACFGAHFLDKHGQPIPRTLVRTRYVGGPHEPSGWIRVELFLASAPAQAHSIGLTAWVVQEPIWRTTTPPHHIPRVDVFGGAWLDDITIYRLPQAQISSSASGNVLSPDGPQTLQVLLADHDDVTLEGTLTILNAGGGSIQTQPVSVNVGDDARPVRIDVNHLAPGLYQARLEVFSGEKTILTRSLMFARLAQLLGHKDSTARSLGVILDPAPRRDMGTEVNLLRHQAVQSAKLPVWGGLADDEPAPERRRMIDRFYQELIKEGFALTGVFAGPPAALVRGQGSYVRPLIELLTEEVSLWEEYLAAVAAPYASVFRWWQLGSDTGEKPPPIEQLQVAAGQLRQALRQYITVPLLIAPRSSSSEAPRAKLPVDQVTVDIGPEFGTESFSTILGRIRQQGYLRVSAHVAPLPSGQYRRIPRLADWARRIITALHVGFDTIYVPQTWTVRETPLGVITEPNETYLILRTLADLLGDATPGQRLAVANGVQCLAFRSGGASVLAMWDQRATTSPRTYAIQLGRASRRIDLWGRQGPLKRNARGQQIVKLSAMPILVDNVESWLVDFRASLGLNPTHVESGRESVRFALEMAYQNAEPISGHGVLEAPQGWELRPRTFSFTLTAQRTERVLFEARVPHNEPVGRRKILAKVTLDETGYYLEVPLYVEVGLSDVEVSGLTIVETETLVLRQIVTNLSDEILSFRATANVPGRQRQYRPIVNLAPGDSQTVEYRFSDALDLIGRNVQLSLREMNDGPRVHTLELLVP